MGGAAVVVDIGAVGLVVIAAHLRAQLLEHHGRDLIACALGAVQHHVQAIQPHIGGFFDKIHIAAGGVALAHGTAHALADGHFKIGGHPAGHDFLDAVLNGVGQLVAVFVKELDAVVLDGIVAGADDRARVRLVKAGEVGDGRGGQHLHQHGARTHAANAGDQRALQHFTAQARISPHKDGGAMHVAGQHIGAGLTQAESKFTGEFRVGDAAHAVGSEQSGHSMAPFRAQAQKTSLFLLSYIRMPLRKAMAFSSPSRGDIRLSSCSMDNTSSYPARRRLDTMSFHTSASCP